MDVKEAFNHVPKGQILQLMIELEIDHYLVAWTESFLRNRKIQLVIDGYDKKESKIETGFPQGLTLSLILLLIYIGGVLYNVSGTNSSVISQSIGDDLGFIASGNIVK